MDSYPLLASPLEIGPFELRNRLVQTGHATAMAEDGLPGAQLAAYYSERAWGGVAMIITEAQSVHPSAAHMASTVRLYDPRISTAYRLISDDLHAAGARFVAQLWHCGNNTDSMVTDRAAWSASAVAGPLNHEIPHAVTVEEIAELVSAYARAAANARAGGVDGVEIHMGHGYLPQQFMSPVTNHRRDAYGGSHERRMRFPLEVLAAVAEAAGPELALGVRLSGEEGVPHGLGIDQTREIAAALCATGLVSYLSISFGTYANMEIQTAPMGTPAGHLAPLAAAVRARVEVPVLAVGRMLSPAVGESVLAGGAADMIGLARELICDPDFADKALGGRDEEIRPCIGCNYCQSRLWAGRHVTCVHNPAAGRERELGRRSVPPPSSHATARRVVVIGGGPAGMEAAIVAARAGHRVELRERESELGGALRLAWKPASRGEMRKVRDHRCRLLATLGVRVLLDSDVTLDQAERLDCDTVVLATGAAAHAAGFNFVRPDLFALPGIEGAYAVSGAQALEGELANGARNILVVDFQGHVEALAVAEFLLDAGHTVEILTPMPQVGLHVGGTGWVKLMQIVRGKGARLTPNANVGAIDGRRIKISDVFGGPDAVREDVDAIVVCGDARSSDELLAPLHSIAGLRVLSAGDCVAPRHLDMAILEGHRAGRAA